MASISEIIDYIDSIKQRRRSDSESIVISSPTQEYANSLYKLFTSMGKYKDSGSLSVSCDSGKKQIYFEGKKNRYSGNYLIVIGKNKTKLKKFRDNGYTVKQYSHISDIDGVYTIKGKLLTI